MTFTPFQERGLYIQEQRGQKDRAEHKAFPPLMRSPDHFENFPVSNFGADIP